MCPWFKNIILLIANFQQSMGSLFTSSVGQISTFLVDLICILYALILFICNALKQRTPNNINTAFHKIRFKVYLTITVSLQVKQCKIVNLHSRRRCNRPGKFEYLKKNIIQVLNINALAWTLNRSTNYRPMFVFTNSTEKIVFNSLN